MVNSWSFERIFFHLHYFGDSPGLTMTTMTQLVGPAILYFGDDVERIQSLVSVAGMFLQQKTLILSVHLICKMPSTSLV